MSENWHFEKVIQLQSYFKEDNITAGFIFNHIELFYFTGYTLGNLLYIPESGSPILFVRRSLERIHTLIPFQVVLFKSFRDIIPHINIDSHKKIALPFDTTNYTLITKLIESLDIPQSRLENLNLIMNKIAQTKSSQEIAAMNHAGILINEAFNALKEEKVEGLTEIEISSFLSHFMKTRGYIGEDRFKAPNHPSLGPVVLTKENILITSTSDTPYAGPGFSGALASGSSTTQIERNIPFVVDIVCNTQGLYCDITRTCIVGEIPPILSKRYKDLLDIYNFILEQMKVGVLCSTVYHKTLEFVENMGYSDNFMGLYNNKVSFIGHSIGIFVDEYPALAPVPVPITENSVFAIEPKLFFSDFYCVGIENTIQIKNNSLYILTPLSNDIIVIPQ